MCGIVGYVGSRQAAPILLDGLRRLEYRGYDSAGMAVCGPAGLQVYKTPGRLAALAELTADGAALTGTVSLTAREGGIDFALNGGEAQKLAAEL